MALPSETLNGISLCSGAGGLELGLHLAAPAYRTVCYVERDAFAAATLVARMEDQAMDDAPIWSDARRFDGRPWRGKVDIISAGYPCQPFTFSGLRKGTEDPRHLWPHVARVIAEVQPGIVFCENVEGHLSLGFPDVARDLQAMGYSVRAGLFSAAEAGAAHIRRRLFILAYAHCGNVGQQGGNKIRRARPKVFGGKGQRWKSNFTWRSSQDVDDVPFGGSICGVEGGSNAHLPTFAPTPCDHQAWEQALDRRPELQPCLFGLDHGLANRVERSMLAGNGVCPLAAAIAFKTLTEGVLEKL